MVLISKFFNSSIISVSIPWKFFMILSKLLNFSDKYLFKEVELISILRSFSFIPILTIFLYLSNSSANF
jgi:hypothetical protein